MNPLRENEKEKNQKKEEERKHHPHPRACEGVDIQAYSEAWQRGFTTQVFNDLAGNVGLTCKQRKAWLKYMHEVGWCLYDGKPVTPINCRRSMRMWRVVDERMAAEAKSGGRVSSETKAFQNEYEVMKQREAARRVEMATKPENWELCEERCKNCIVCDAINKFTGEKFVVYSCLKGYKVPPPVRERPIAPEECAGFDRQEV